MALLPALAALPYLVLLIWILGKLLKATSFSAGGSAGTFVSVIVPCRNEEANIKALLEDLAAQDYPAGSYEVIVVDDNSDDNTYDTAMSFHSDRSIRLLRSEGRGKKAAIRTAVMHSSGELIVTTDADCRVGSRWLKTIESFYALHKPSMIILPVALATRGNISGRFQEMEFLALQGITAGTAIGGSAIMCNGANLAFTRNAYTRNSGSLRHDIAGGDDIFLLQGIKRDSLSAIRWLESAEALAVTRGMNNIISLVSQRSRWISKSPHYRDAFTVLTGIVTFVTLLIQAGLILSCLFDTSLIYTALVFTGLKSIPDILLILNRSRMYNIKARAAWFIPFQLIYPFYVLAVVLRSCLPAGRWR